MHVLCSEVPLYMVHTCILLQLLVSPIIASRIYNHQIDYLISYYLNTCTNTQGWMTLESFAPVARAMLLMVYQNTYPVEVNNSAIVPSSPHMLVLLCSKPPDMLQNLSLSHSR